MKGNNFIWAVKEMQNRKKVTREGFKNIDRYLEMDYGLIHFSKELKKIRSNLYDEDYLAEDWVLWK